MIFDGYLLCTDHDGTVAENGEILPENRKAIDYFQQNGGIFTVATGRRQDFVTEQYADIIKPHVPVIIANGTMLYDITDRKIIHKEMLSPDHYGTLLDAYVHAGGANYLRIELENETLWFKVGEAGKDLIIERLSGRDVSKIVLDFSDLEKTLCLQRYLTEKYCENYNIVRSWATGLELFSKGAGKGTGITLVKQYIAERLGTSIHTVIGMGDFENDISLIEAADIGVAMGNAPSCVKAHADYIAECSADAGAAKFIYSLGNTLRT